MTKIYIYDLSPNCSRFEAIMEFLCGMRYEARTGRKPYGETVSYGPTIRSARRRAYKRIARGWTSNTKQVE